MSTISLSISEELPRPKVINYTDDELVKQVRHYYGDVKCPILRAALERLDDLVMGAPDKVDHTELTEAELHCPACGTSLDLEVSS